MVHHGSAGSAAQSRCGRPWDAPHSCLAATGGRRWRGLTCISSLGARSRRRAVAALAVLLAVRAGRRGGLRRRQPGQVQAVQLCAGAGAHMSGQWWA
jgi:hypothetical protein